MKFKKLEAESCGACSSNFRRAGDFDTFSHHQMYHATTMNIAFFSERDFLF